METTINNLKAISTARIRLKDLHTHEDGDGENLAWSCIVFLKGKRLGSVQDPGEEKTLSIEIDSIQQVAMVKALKEHGYQLNLEAASQIDASDTHEYLEQALPQMADEVEWFNKAKPLLKSNTLFRIRGDEEGTFRLILALYNEKTEHALQSRFGDQLEAVLNNQLKGITL